eukprot:4605125-Amphidinium_carterae.3
MAFAVVMEVAFKHLEEELRRQDINCYASTLVHAYTDDTVIPVPQHAAEAVMTGWQGILQGMGMPGMELQVSKTICCINPPCVSQLHRPYCKYGEVNPDMMAFWFVDYPYGMMQWTERLGNTVWKPGFHA